MVARKVDHLGGSPSGNKWSTCTTAPAGRPSAENADHPAADKVAIADDFDRGPITSDANAVPVRRVDQRLSLRDQVAD